MSTKILKIGKGLRDLVLSQPETLVFTRTRCQFRGEMYSYPAVTNTEIKKEFSEIRKLIKSWL